MRQPGWIAGAVVALAILSVTGAPSAQPAPGDRTAPPPGQPEPAQPAPVPVPPPGPATPTETPPPTQQEPEPIAPDLPSAEERRGDPQPVPEEPFPTRTPTFVGPDLFNPPAHQGWLNITPSFTLSGEYNDNIFATREDRQSDFIIGLTPGVTVSAQRPSYRLLAGYNTSGEIFVDNSDLSDFGKQQNFFGDFTYFLSPRLSFSVSDRFIYGRFTNTLTAGGVSVGLQDAWRNTFTPRLRYQLTERTGLTLTGSYTIVRFTEDDDGGSDSDTYRVRLGLGHELTPRLTLTAGVGAAYIDIEDEDVTWTYTPTIGATYAFTQTLTGTVSGGPTVVVRDGDTILTPGVSARLLQRFRFGTVGVGYNRAVAAETIGISDVQVFFASLSVPTLLRGLSVGFIPRYTIVNRDRDLVGADDDTTDTVTLSLRATYQIARSISLIGSYTFFHQTDDRSGGNRDIDQNRVFLGIQYAFPINIY